MQKTWEFSINESITTEQVENIVAKGEITRFEQFLHLSQCFQKSSAADASKFVYNLERVKFRKGEGTNGHVFLFVHHCLLFTTGKFA